MREDIQTFYLGEGTKNFSHGFELKSSKSHLSAQFLCKAPTFTLFFNFHQSLLALILIHKFMS